MVASMPVFLAAELGIFVSLLILLRTRGAPQARRTGAMNTLPAAGERREAFTRPDCFVQASA